MKSRFLKAALLLSVLSSMGASARTTNFVVSAPDQPLANDVARLAEKYRKDLAVEWLGEELPRWRQPCPITVTLARGAGGATSFMFDRGRPFGWTMSVQGSPQRILDSVLPHEVTHTIFATHFGRPLPRWADEGACTTVEDVSERRKQDHLLVQFLTSRRGIPFNQMFAMKEYPRDILPLYSQGYSLAKFLIAQGGKRKYIKYVGDGMEMNDWNAATRRHYGYKNLSELQVTWNKWVASGSPAINQPPTQILASTESNPRSSLQVAAATSGDATSGDATTRMSQPTNNNSQFALVSASREPGVAPASNSQGGLSWYAKRRDQHQASPSRAMQPSNAARPTQPQTPRQAVLQWDSGGSTSTSRLTPVQPPASYGMPAGPTTTILR